MYLVSTAKRFVTIRKLAHLIKPLSLKNEQHIKL